MRRLFTYILYALLILSASALHASQLKISDLEGKWQLLYRGHYGYQFQFHKNYIAHCIIFLNTSTVIFKGVYTIEGGDTVRINISEMKKQNGTANIDLRSHFVKTSSTYFLFTAWLEGKSTLKMSPKKIIIDGNSSDGYFEPDFRLNRI